jgi:broad specificity phosphatase PhoE
MNKTVLFVRHGRLVAPFADYNRLAFAQLRQLSLRTIDPGIDRTGALMDLSQGQKMDVFARCEEIMVSESKRTLETALVINKNVRIIRTSCLNEILFDVNGLVSENEFGEKCVESVREALFGALLENTNLESLEMIYGRLEQLDNLIRESENEKIVCVTHGFFMRFIQLYFMNNIRIFDQITMQDILSVKNPDYLDVLEIKGW